MSESHSYIALDMDIVINIHNAYPLLVCREDGEGSCSRCGLDGVQARNNR